MSSSRSPGSRYRRLEWGVLMQQPMVADVRVWGARGDSKAVPAKKRSFPPKAVYS